MAVANDLNAVLRIGVAASDDGDFDNELDGSFTDDQFVQFKNNSSEDISELELTIENTSADGDNEVAINDSDEGEEQFGFGGVTLEEGDFETENIEDLSDNDDAIIGITPSGENTLEFDLTAEFNGTTLSLTREADFNEN